MERRVFLAILLSFSVLFAYQAFFAPQQQQREAQQAAANAPASQSPAAPAAAQTAQPPSQMPAALVAGADARDVVLETDKVRAVFNTRGAVLTSWQLKDYKNSTGQPFDLVPRDLPATHARPFAIRTGDATLDAQLDAAVFKETVNGQTVTFEYRDASGLDVRKQFTLSAGHPYVLENVITLDRGGSKPPFQIAFGPSLGEGYTTSGSMYYYPPGAIYSDGADVERLDADDITEQPRYQGNYRWAGVADHYFLSALIGQGQPVAVTFAPVALPVPGAVEGTQRTFVSWTADAASDARNRVFLGPKDFDTLRAVEGSLVRAIDFGMFAWLVVPLLTALKWVNGYIGNYGWSIIVLTILINALMAPLRHKSLVSMKKMQKLQPEVKAIQKKYERYKVTDPERQKMNAEMMELYKRHGVNPASGCVPMLLTLPLLFAFYALLSVAIELRGAPFIGWIHDLAAHDPLYITPVLMGATMLWQQWITPSTADPVQQRMMLIMPVVFLVMFLWAPAGLVLYWLFSNLWAIGQQLATNRLTPEAAGVPAQPPAVRRVKQKKQRGQND